MGTSGISCRLARFLSSKNQPVRHTIAEMVGTFVLVVFNIGAGCQANFDGSPSANVTANLSAALGVAMGIYVSGGCVNPAISLAMCLTKRTKWRLYPFHVLGQIIGAFLGAAAVYGIYYDALNDFDGGNRQIFGDHGTARPFCTFPKDIVSTVPAFFDSTLGSMLLILCTLAFVDSRNSNPHPSFVPLLVGILVICIGGSIGSNTGSPINPARDLGPRLFLLAAGWGSTVFSHKDYMWFWIPVVGPLVGSTIGVLIYTLFISLHWPEETQVTTDTPQIENKSEKESMDTKSTVSPNTIAISRPDHQTTYKNDAFVEDHSSSP